MSSDVLTVRLPRELKEKLVAESGSQGKKLSPFVVAILQDALCEGPEPYNPFGKYHPHQRIVDSSQISSVWAELAGDLLEREPQCGDGEEGGVSARSGRQLRSEMRLFLPTVLWLGEAGRSFRLSFQYFKRHLDAFLKKPGSRCRIITVDAANEEAAKTDGLMRSEVQAFELTRRATSGRFSAGEKDDNTTGVVEHRSLFAEQISLPGFGRDRSFLYPFQVFGQIAVTFTVETSYGAPYEIAESREERDITYWQERFEEMWALAEEHAELLDSNEAGQTRISNPVRT